MRQPPDRRAAFTELYETHHEAVLAYARRRVPIDEVDDVAADVWSVAWRRIDSVPPERALAWLLTCGRNVIGARSRQQRRQSAKQREAQRLSPVSSGDHAHGVAERDVVLSALARLGPADQELLRLVAWDGLPPADAARVLRITRVALNQRLSRARRRLARHLEALEADRDPPAIQRVRPTTTARTKGEPA